MQQNDFKISWCRAFVKAYTSRGAKRRCGKQRPTSHTNTSSSISRISRKSRFRSTMKRLQTSACSTSNCGSSNKEGATKQQQQDVDSPLPLLGERKKIVLFAATVNEGGINDENDKEACLPDPSQKLHTVLHSPLVLVEEEQQLKEVANDDAPLNINQMNEEAKNEGEFSEEILSALS